MQVQSASLCSYSDSPAKTATEGAKLCFIYSASTNLVCAVPAMERAWELGHGAGNL